MESVLHSYIVERCCASPDKAARAEPAVFGEAGEKTVVAKSRARRL
jgi:hypothetical protein